MLAPLSLSLFLPLIRHEIKEQREEEVERNGETRAWNRSLFRSEWGDIN